MEALVVRRLGDPTLAAGTEASPFVAASGDHPVPALSSPTAVRVRVAATSLNFATLLQVQGKYQERPQLPFVPGSDYAGVVDAVGPGVRRFRPGDRVCSFPALGSFAEFIVADEDDLFLVPDGIDLVTAGALPAVFGTSHVSLVHRAHLEAGQVILVLGASGGVGTSAVQIAKVCGAIVIAIASGTEKLQYLKSIGADHVIDSREENLLESAKCFLKDRCLKGVDVLYDVVGGKLSQNSLALLNWGAHILVIGFASGDFPVIQTNVVLHKNWTVHGMFWTSYRIHQPQVFNDSLNKILSWLSKGLIKIHISHIYRLSEAHLAFAALKERKAIGKIMIVMVLSPKSRL
ncbi:Quinone oxidoreductase-like protein 2-like protein [Dichanthelium oligosanthes]|uniref:Quinone oxidoreductase-like protein 2-like protein n=1 Tax=Dichanthelium oligosanthes TaxID=888268 RepID=A0A1E5VI17_9POAL|nr:Quinone oxidoreductase-like protein 2-like protein [Dichanthelium oligosanthes]